MATFKRDFKFNDNIKENISKNIKKYREKKELIQYQLATLCNLSIGFISDLESNTFRTISLNTMCLIAKKLEIHVKQLLDDIEN